jgi:hypothetical protein
MKSQYILELKPLIFCLVIVLGGCKNNGPKSDTTPKNDTITAKSETTKTVKPENQTDSLQPKKVYSNQRFRDVTAEKIDSTAFRIKGEGQIFEANFNWVVEDGHEELKTGYQMTDAGAPEWGKFSFTIDVEKKRPNSTLHLILFEISAKDGSRQHELPIFLY